MIAGDYFQPYPKTERWKNVEFYVTEKIDGTNGCVIITNDGEDNVIAQSRNHLLTIDDDNFGFARWVEDNKEDLKKLGPGYHYGEWWGKGIGRGYGIEDRRFSLFDFPQKGFSKPDCCEFVPSLGLTTPFNRFYPQLFELVDKGSKASPGFMDPEGIIIQLKKFPHRRYKILLQDRRF